MLEHNTLEVLVLTRCWGGDCSFALRCMMLASIVPSLCNHVHLKNVALRLFECD